MKLGPRRKGHRGGVGWFADILNVKALVGAFNQEKALKEAFFVIVKTLPINRLQL